MNVFEIRRKNLSALIEKHGLVNVARSAGKQKSQLCNITTQNRNMGEKLARELERLLSLEVGYFDIDQDNKIGLGVELSQVGQQRVPLVDWSLICQDNASSSLYLLTDMKLSNKTFALEITDGSMLPEFGQGDKIIVDPSIKPNPSDYVIAKANDHFLLRKYRLKQRGLIELLPLNPDFPSVDSDETTIEFIGVVVEHRKYRR